MSDLLLLDTHILVRWLTDDHRLSKEQIRVLELAEKRRVPLGISAISLVELALLFSAGTARTKRSPEFIFERIDGSGAFTILPITMDVAREMVAVVPVLKDPVDATIAATARVHGLRLVTSDQRILGANVVSTVG